MSIGTYGAADQPRLCFLISADAGVTKLRRIPVAMIARGFKGKQQFAVTREDMAQIVRNFRARGTGEVVIDYDHSTEFAAGGGNAVPAAGWLKRIDDAPDAAGVLWGEAEFTERAAKMLAAREYKYFSPVIVWGARSKADGEPQGTTLTSIGLTNSPLLERLPAFTMSEAGWGMGRGGDEDASSELARTALLASDVEQFETALVAMTKEKVSGSGGKLQFHEAMKLIAREHPEIDRRRTELYRRKQTRGDI
jgi:phage I-like protein